MEGDRWNRRDRGVGTRENRGRERDLSEGESGSSIRSDEIGYITNLVTVLVTNEVT